MSIKRKPSESFAKFQIRRDIDNRARKRRLRGVLIHESLIPEKDRDGNEILVGNTLVGVAESRLKSMSPKQHAKLYKQLSY